MTLYAALNRNIKAWPPYVGDRAKQRRAILQDLEILRETRKNKGFLEYHPNECRFCLLINPDRHSHTLSGLEWIDGIWRDIAMAAGIPVINL